MYSADRFILNIWKMFIWYVQNVHYCELFAREHSNSMKTVLADHFKDFGFVLVSMSFLLPAFCQFDSTKLCGFHYSFHEQPETSSVYTCSRLELTDMWLKFI